MKWNAKEVDVYLTSKSYIDTALVTLIPISFGEDMKQIVSMGEFSTVLSAEIERQLHGRIFAVPPFTYFKTEEQTEKMKKLKQWISELKNCGFNYIFLITSDHEWKTFEDELEAKLIWIPAIPLEHMDDKYKSEILHEQTKQILQIVTNQWQSAF